MGSEIKTSLNHADWFPGSCSPSNLAIPDEKREKNKNQTILMFGVLIVVAYC